MAKRKERETQAFVCSRCPGTREAKVRPRGWKLYRGELWCDDCWRRAFVLRAQSVPIAGPVVDGGPEEQKAAWVDLREALDNAWANSTTLANWYVTELAKADTVRTPAMERMPAFTAPYLYNEARAVCPTMDPASVQALTHAVERRYGKRRFAVIWKRDESLPNYTYPVPYPIRVGGNPERPEWRIQAGPGGSTFLSFLLGGVRRTVRLRGGREFARQMKAVRLLATGVALPAELSLIGPKASASANRNGTTTREPGGGRQKHRRIMAKMVMWLPKRTDNREGGALHVRTGGGSFCSYFVVREGEVEPASEPRHLNADHVRRWVRAHYERNARAAEDLKHEKRWPKPVRRGMVEAQEPRLQKFHNRINTFIHQTSAMLAGYATRQRVVSVVYDDSDHSFIPAGPDDLVKFPWAALRTMLEYKLDEAHIEFTPVGVAPDGDDDVDDEPAGD